MSRTFPCLKCNRPLTQSGEVAFEGAPCPVFQCDDCIVEVEMFGEPFQVALTFALDANDIPFDPATDTFGLPL